MQIDEAQLSALLSVGLELLFYLLLLVFTLYTLFLAYHWFAYGVHRKDGIIALSIFIAGSIPLFFVMMLML